MAKNRDMETAMGPLAEMPAFFEHFRGVTLGDIFTAIEGGYHRSPREIAALRRAAENPSITIEAEGLMDDPEWWAGMMEAVREEELRGLEAEAMAENAEVFRALEEYERWNPRGLVPVGPAPGRLEEIQVVEDVDAVHLHCPTCGQHVKPKGSS